MPVGRKAELEVRGRPGGQLWQALYMSCRLRMPGDLGVRFGGLELTSQRGGSPTTLVHTIPGRMGMPSLPRAVCSRPQALGPRRVTGTVRGELVPVAGGGKDPTAPVASRLDG